MAKSKTRLVADFMGKVQADPVTGEAVQTDVQAVSTVVEQSLGEGGTVYTAAEVDAMFDDVITEIENLTVTGV